MAQDGIETELKWALAADGHAALEGRLAALLGPGRILEQRNRFFDSADGRLRAAGLAVRIRHENDRIVLTCKSRRSAAHAQGLHVHGEIESILLRDPGPDGLAGLLPPAWTIALDGAGLADLGGFSNRRVEHHDGPHLLCLDRTDFAVRIDHELEIETSEPDAAAVRWVRLLADWGVPWQPQPLTKLHRYLALRNPSPGRPTG